MTISVNSKEMSTAAATLSELRTELGLPETGLAIAVNNKMIPKEGWGNFSIRENDRILIIKAACGG